MPDWVIVAGTVVLSLVTLAGPVARMLYRVEINYNEGWNAYNADRASHLPLYFYKYSWTTVNYPVASFYLIGHLSRFMGDPVIIGRALSLMSLLISCILVALIIKKLTTEWGAAIIGGSFCLALFCSMAPNYVAANDPQMLGQAFLLFGLFLYFNSSASGATIFIITVLFVVAGNIKHNLLSAPVSFCVECFLLSRTKALHFLLFGVVLLMASIAINMWVGGPFFVANMLAPRPYSSLVALGKFVARYEALQIPFIIAVGWSILHLRNIKVRLVAFYFLVSLIIAIAFAGGEGVVINVYFDNFFAMSIIVGLVLHFVWELQIQPLRKGGRWRWVPALVIVSPVLFAFSSCPYADVPKYIYRLPEKERQFSAEVSFLAARPGLAICESLLRCYYAGKLYMFDPFNSTMLVRAKRLNGQEMIEKVVNRKIAVIQTSMPVTEIQRPYARFPSEFLEVVDRYYQIAWRDTDCVFYVPRE